MILKSLFNMNLKWYLKGQPPPPLSPIIIFKNAA